MSKGDAFAKVAKIIAKGPPPIWLIPALEHFSGGIAGESDNQHFKALIAQIETATDTLIRWLPVWQHMPWGLKCPDYVQYIRAFLPELKRDLERLTEKRKGEPPDVRREVCAAVVVGAWQRIHGKGHGSIPALEACNAYWRACGGEPIGETEDPLNWRRVAKLALSEDYSWVRDTLAQYEISIK